jgi:hypothetical protein
LELGIPVPAGLTADEIAAIERFSVCVWGRTLFDHEPSHNGRHGWNCPACVPVLEDRRLRLERKISQPWDA